MKRPETWKVAALAAMLLAALLIGLPTLFGDDPAVQIAREDRVAIDADGVRRIDTLLTAAGIESMGTTLERNAAVTRFPAVEEQLRAQELLGPAFPGHTVALSFAPRTPAWLARLGITPVALGLDLRGGVQFLYNVDVQAAVRPLLEARLADLRDRLRRADIRVNAGIEGDAILVGPAAPADRAGVERVLRELERDAGSVGGMGVAAAGMLSIESVDAHDGAGWKVALSEAAVLARQNAAVDQNVLTLRNRVNELGIAEPVVQRQGQSRIVVELPGVQDPAQAARLLGVAATLQFRLVDTNPAIGRDGLPRTSVRSTVYPHRDGYPIALLNEVVASGDQLLDATAIYSEGQPAVSIRLDPQAARRMLDTTQRNIGRQKAVLFITQKPERRVVDGETVFVTETEEVVVSAPVIRGVYGSNFQITGLRPFEAQDLALLLRSGSLAAPIALARQSTIGPSLGQDNIAKGRLAIVVGFLAVVAFMALYYRVFGMIANLALLANVIFVVALLALLPVSLTLPGIAGIVLTIGMAVDANVLIFERIREELRAGRSAPVAIDSGYDKAFSSIADANVTTLIAALVLLAFGTGPIKGFAITLSLGIMTSMFTAIVGTRIVIGLIYGGRKLGRISIGGEARAVP
jgi:preprotein translocase subunit SecD